MEKINIIITTSDTTSSLPSLLTTGWVAANITTSTVSALNNFEQAATVNFYNPCNYNTFSDGGFSDFETKIASDTNLLSGDTWLPIGNYGINMSTTPFNVLISSSLTDEQKSAISYSLSCQNKGYYVIVSTTETSTTFTDYLGQYGILFDTPENIKKKFGK